MHRSYRAPFLAHQHRSSASSVRLAPAMVGLAGALASCVAGSTEGGDAVVEIEESAAAASSVIEADTMSLSGSVVRVYSDSSATASKAVRFYTNGSAKTTVSGALQQVAIRARANLCDGSPVAAVYVDGNLVLNATVSGTTYTTYSAALNLSAGAHSLEVRYSNDASTSLCDRDLVLDNVTVTLGEPPTSNPFAGEKFYVDPRSPAATTVATWSAEGRQEDAQQLRKIADAAKPVRYFAEWTETGNSNGVEFQVKNFVSTVKAAGALPVMGAYAILHRDCSSFSEGGFTEASQYRDWIDGFARGIGDDKAIVFLEPDAIAYMSCLSEEQKIERLDLLKYAVYSLKSRPNAHVYIDAGHSAWHTPDVVISRLKEAGIERADGFSTNNANFQLTANEIAWGEKVSAGVGGKHFVVDTARNGLGPYTGGTHDGDCPAWANPPGRALGSRPTADTGHPLVDAFYWLKSPGASDADCGGFPAAGKWSAEYALGLCERSVLTVP
ncbi:glycoside hydrolase family 6 protein [Sorangium sp. So ce131]|uniref:glycoside hydrolase family 6 protein n=1 Tax=Sorangium sp. So ce131 TaxID=3133282 RepID=UPI003F62C516